MSTIQEIYKKRIAEAQEKVKQSNVAQELELKALSNTRYQEIVTSIKRETGLDTWSDFSFRTGKITGILRTILNNPAHRKKLLAITGLEDYHIDMYYETCGNLPFMNTTTKTLNEGRPMNIEPARELIQLVGLQLGILVEDKDLEDITQERWDMLTLNAKEKALETIKFNKENIGNENLSYDE